ncbi:MAG: hypothetical protein IPG74_18875 [Flavobacteriales bacterium]|nr:hypothetical protein [Flavobacteriales bacterium]
MATRRILAFGCALALVNMVLAQGEDKIPRDLIEQRVEAAAEQLGEDSDVDLTVLFDMLAGYYQDPMNLNRVDAEELGSLQLLNDGQIGALLAHINDHGRLLSIYELQAINGWDARTIQLVRPFVVVRENDKRTQASFKEIMKNATHEVIVRSVLNVEERKGFMDRDNIFGRDYSDPDGDALPDFTDTQVVDSLRDNGRVYLGSPVKLYARYRFRYRQNISFGITAEKDEGEEFFQGTQKQGFDFYSAHLFVRNIGPLKSLAIGDYQAQFGQGLTYWSGLAFGSKSAYTMNVKRNGAGLLPYASVNENLFLRGIGATVGLGKTMEFTAFYSQRKLDANTDSISTQDNSAGDVGVIFSSFQEDGLHRTPNELEKKDALDARTIGGHLRYKRKALSIGGTVANISFNTPLVRDTRPYSQFEFQGSENTTMGIDLNWLWRNVSVFGEVARSSNGGLAYNIGTLLALDKAVSLAVVYRNYQRDFHGLVSTGFAEGSSPWNERGIYTGIEIKPSREWLVNAYFDRFSFPWLRYLTDAPSDGYEALAQVTWRPSRKTELYVRARYQDKAKNTAEDIEGIDFLVRTEQTNYRFNASYRVTDAVSLRTRVEAINYQRGEEPLQHGFLIYQDFVSRPLRSTFEYTLRVALFDTDNYDTRVYAFENDIIGLFSIPPYYGRGMRWYAMVRATPLRRVDIWLRYGAWLYNDQDSYSSGLQEINGSVRSEVKMQVRVMF